MKHCAVIVLERLDGEMQFYRALPEMTYPATKNLVDQLAVIPDFQKTCKTIHVFIMYLDTPGLPFGHTELWFIKNIQQKPIKEFNLKAKPLPSIKNSHLGDGMNFPQIGSHLTHDALGQMLKVNT